MMETWRSRLVRSVGGPTPQAQTPTNPAKRFPTQTPRSIKISGHQRRVPAVAWCASRAVVVARARVELGRHDLTACRWSGHMRRMHLPTKIEFDGGFTHHLKRVISDAFVPYGDVKIGVNPALIAPCNSQRRIFFFFISPSVLACTYIDVMEHKFAAEIVRRHSMGSYNSKMLEYDI